MIKARTVNPTTDITTTNCQGKPAILRPSSFGGGDDATLSETGVWLFDAGFAWRTAGSTPAAGRICTWRSLVWMSCRIGWWVRMWAMALTSSDFASVCAIASRASMKTGRTCSPQEVSYPVRCDPAIWRIVENVVLKVTPDEHRRC